MAKILFITRVPSTAVRFILPLAVKLRDRGNDIEFAFGPGEGLAEMEASGFPFHLLTINKRSRSIKNSIVIFEIRKIIKSGRYNIIHTYSPVIGLYGRLAALNTGKGIVVHSVIGSMLSPGVPIVHRLFYFITEFFTSRMVDLFITLNDADANDLIRFKLASSDKVLSLKYEYGVNLNEFNPERVDNVKIEELRKHYNIATGVPVIGFIGRLIGAKGILDLFEAYRIIRSNGIYAKMLYLGDVLSSDKDQNSKKYLEELIEKYGFESDVTFLGFQREVPLYISLMDIVVLPSHYEGFPRIPVEAGAMKKPSISTATAGAEVAISDGITGFVVPIKNPVHLAEALTKLILNPELAQTMGTSARERIVALFDQDKIVDQQVGIYAEFIKSRKKNCGFQV